MYLSKQMQFKSRQDSSSVVKIDPPKSFFATKKLSGMHDRSLESPCRRIAQLELRPKMKSSKLLSSKSLSQLIPRSLFFRKVSRSENSDKKQATLDSSDTKSSTRASCLLTSNSFPSRSFNPSCINKSTSSAPETMSSRIKSISPLALPRQSTNAALSGQFTLSNNSSPIDLSNLSPIMATRQRMRLMSTMVAESSSQCSHELRIETDSSQGNSTEDVEQKQQVETKETLRACKQKEPETKANGYIPSRKCKPFKSTALVLRDVKNSIGLRIRAKHESQAFAKLTNELATPPTKLYSPFHIYSPDLTTKDQAIKSKRKLNWNGQTNKNKSANSKNQNDRSTSDIEASLTTPKNRVALQHKRHLMQANKFVLQRDSPTGRLRETVKEVEQFQKCIEDISSAIRARGQSGG